ncbi:type II secretion system protein [Novosphingobium sp.]|uniref:pilus assembly FimT family protein n=1 Tax=Novosphingobium sp. TaxID=1874826 RepID=UPI00262EEE77|nr:type II secretion system protein [Novosphingobium sp.]
MLRASALPPAKRADSGFTLLEMLVVLAITGLITGLLYPQIGTATLAIRQRLAREQVAAGVEAARAMALRSGGPVALSADRDAPALLVGGTRRITLDATGQIRLTMRPQTIMFYPDGSTTGGQLVLGTGRDAAAFDVPRAGAGLRAVGAGGA